jgi:hypothetical protein
MLLNFATLGRQMGPLHNLRLAIYSTAVSHIRSHEACAFQIVNTNVPQAYNHDKLRSRKPNDCSIN